MNNCPSDMEMLMLLEENLPAGKAADIKDHIENCEECFFIYDTEVKIRKSKNEEFYSAPTDEEKIKAENRLKALIKQKKSEKTGKQSQPEQSIWQTLMSTLFPSQRHALLAADQQTADQKQIKAALSTQALSFIANCDKDDPSFWRAIIRLPTEPTPETELGLKLTGSDGRPIPQGTLIFCGIEKSVIRGRCYVPLSELKAHQHQHSIVLRFPSGKTVEGVQEPCPDQR